MTAVRISIESCCGETVAILDLTEGEIATARRISDAITEERAKSHQPYMEVREWST